MKNSFNLKILKNILGMLLLIVGICFNKVILEFFLSPYAIIEFNSRIPVSVVSLLFSFVGIVILTYPEKYINIQIIKRLYKFIAYNFLSVIAIFILVNVLCLTVLFVKDIEVYKSQIFLAYRQPLEPLYPGFTKKQINALLTETWSRPYIYEPYTQFKERPFMGKYINVSHHGFRHVQNQGQWPPSPENLNIFFFGGSTAFGYGVADKQTIASYIQDYSRTALRKNVSVYNFGRGNYFSSQERILFEQMLTKGYIPDVVVFIDGLNDFYYSNDEPLYTEQFEKFVSGKHTLYSNIPLFNLVSNLITHKQDAQKYHRMELKDKQYDNPQLLKQAIYRYVQNKKTIEQISKAFDIKPFFIWQPVPTYKYDLKYHIFAGKGFGRFMYSKYGYAYMEEFVKKHNMGDNFLWLANMQEDMKKPLYIDIDHYSPEMSKEIASRIVNYLKTRI